MPDVSFEAIREEWARDSQLDLDDIPGEVVRRHQQHQKYLELFIQAREIATALTLKLKRVRRERYDYYMGRSDEVSPVRILKSEVDMYVDSDPEVIAVTAKLEAAKMQMDYLERVLWILKDRGSDLRTAFEARKFMEGR